MVKFKINVNDKGNFFQETSFKLAPPEVVGPDPAHAKIKLKLIQPKDAHIKVLTLRINKATHNVALATGTQVTAGPFPILVGDNKISFEGHSDKLKIPHEFELIPHA